MKKILGLAFAGAMLIACGSTNKSSTGMGNTTAANANGEYQPPPSTNTTPPANENMPPNETTPPANPNNTMPTNPDNTTPTNPDNTTPPPSSTNPTP